MKFELTFKISDAARRLTAIVLAAAMLISLAGCGDKGNSISEREKRIEELYGSVELGESLDEDANSATTSNFTLAYSRSDPLNPYVCESSLNATISDLMYDQLIIVNSEFEAEPVIASQIDTSNSLLIIVTLRDGIVFSDGSELTGMDIKYSFEAAKAEGSRFAKQLSNFTSCAPADNLVYFRIAQPDPRAYMLLDFPIIKANTDLGTSVPSENGTNIPIGSGRYKYYSDVEKGSFLVRNNLWYSTNSSNVERISLIPMPTIESIVHSVEIGTVSYFYTDLRDGYPSRINANYSTVDINNLIYLGVNTADARLTKFEVREAISKALDREEIITNAYAGRAYAATGPLTTSWPAAAMAQDGSTLKDTAGAISDLEDGGYLMMDDNYIRNDGNRSLSFSIIVNEDNDFHIDAANRIAEQLKAVGISISVVPLPYPTLRERIAAGEYTLYLAEYALLNNMDFSEIITPNTGLYYGLTPQTTIDAYNNYRSGSAAIEDVIDAFESELPFIPVCYRLGMACYSRSLKANMDVTESDLFYNLQLWDVALAGSADKTPEE